MWTICEVEAPLERRKLNLGSRVLVGSERRMRRSRWMMARI